MSEAAPGTGDDPVFARPERAALAQAVRDLIEASMSTRAASDDELRAATTAVESATRALRPPNSGPGAGDGAAVARPPRSHVEYLPRSPVVGEASPIAPGIDWEVIDGRCIARGVFGAVYEGPPGHVHGGMIALAFDEVLGIVNIANGSPGMTGTLTVRYRRPTPLYQPVVFEAWVERIEGRRIQSKAELRVGETLCAEADGLFVAPRPERAAEYFGAMNATDGPSPRSGS